mgnify:CR=1 FL=1
MEALTWGDIVKWVRGHAVVVKDEDGNVTMKSMKQKTINNKLGPLRACFRYAVDVDGFMSLTRLLPLIVPNEHQNQLWLIQM